MSIESFLTRLLGHIQSAEEQYTVGLEALEGRRSGHQDIAKAVRFLKYAADRGHARAHICLGDCYSRGDGVQQDGEETRSHYCEAVALESAEGMSRLGMCCHFGIGDDRDYQQAVICYRKAADRGDPGGQNGLGLCYEQGLGVCQDHAEAAKWFSTSAGQGYAEAQFNLGRCCSRGTGVPQGHVQAAQWYKLAAEQGGNAVDRFHRKQTRPDIAEAQFALAECYGQGRGVEQDDRQARNWYREAAFRRHPEACRRYAAILRAESEDPDDCSAADQWLRNAEACESTLTPL